MGRDTLKTLGAKTDRSKKLLKRYINNHRELIVK